MPKEVSIYIQYLKLHISKDVIRQKYFFQDEDGNGDEFFESVSKVAEDNFFETGDPTLSAEQFEDIRKLKMKETTVPLFMVVRILDNHYGYYSLN
jgi:hypothetical protein